LPSSIRASAATAASSTRAWPTSTLSAPTTVC
jgi:hypothetical protein